MGQVSKQCRYCDARLDKDGVALNKKLFSRSAETGYFLCLTCMALGLDCTVEDLKDRIVEFKTAGCTLFS